MSLARIAAEGRLGLARGHVHLEAVGSTNEAAFERVPEGGGPAANEAWWTTADTQTRGKGRRGRVWASPPGNLYATALIERPAPGSSVATLPLVAAVALFDAVAEACPAATGRVALKWPNDLLLDGSKVAGILLEVRQFGLRDCVAIGFGVNCRSHPPGMSATDFHAAGLHLEAGDLLLALARRFDRERAEVPATTVARWRDRAAGFGREVVVRLPNEELHGTFEDMAADGRLVLRKTNGERQLIAAGDVFFPSEREDQMIDMERVVRRA